MDYVLYDPATGEIREFGTTSTLASLARPDLIAIEATATGAGNYVDVTTDPVTVRSKTSMGFTVDKTTMTADGVDTVTISGLPAGVTVTVNHLSEVVVIDGSFEFTTDTAGAYHLEIYALEYFTEVLDIDAI
jgi:hypothetical protein